MPRLSNKRKRILKAMAAAKQTSRLNRAIDADTAANIEKLKWAKGRHLNFFEKQCILRAYYSALSLDRVHHRAVKAAGKALMFPPSKVLYIVKSWRRFGEIRASGSGRTSVRRGDAGQEEEKEEEGKEDEGQEDEDDGLGSEERGGTDDEEEGQEDGSNGSSGKSEEKREDEGGGTSTARSQKRADKGEELGGGGSAGRTGFGRGSRGAKRPDRLDL